MSEEDVVSYSPDRPRFPEGGRIEESLRAEYDCARNTRLSASSSEVNRKLSKEKMKELLPHESRGIEEKDQLRTLE